MDKTLFNTRTGHAPVADTKNLAGGKAYSRDPREALAQLAVTGCFGDTYYASAHEQLDEIKVVLALCSPDFVAKCAIYARERANMKDMPAFLLAHLTARCGAEAVAQAIAFPALRAFHAAFPRVIDNGTMLRKFVQVVRSGAVGRKSFGTSVRNRIRTWLLAQSDWRLFKDSVGDQPSLADVIKMVRPNPVRGSSRWALHEYILGKKLTEEHNLVLPRSVLEYECFKQLQLQGKAEVLAVPDVDFRMLDSLKLSDAQWKEVFRRAPWSMTRQNLLTAERHGVLKDPEMVNIIAERLRSPTLVRKSRDFPYTLLSAFIAARDAGLPNAITNALQDAMEIATEKVPVFGAGTVICVDVSGSMQMAPVTGGRGKPTKVRCVEAAALIAATLVRKNPDALLLPFSDRLNLEYKVNSRDSVMTIAQQICALPSGGTDCSLPLWHLNGRNARHWAAVGIRQIVMISDNESWSQPAKFASYGTHEFYRRQGTPLAEAWAETKKRNRDAKLICIDLQPAITTQVKTASDQLNVGGFTDDVWRVVQSFIERGSTSWVDEIERIDLHALDAPAHEA